MSQQYSIGIDIGGTNTKIGLVNSEGLVIKKDRFATGAEESFDIFLGRLKKAVSTLKGQCDIVGVGVGAPNANGLTGMIVNPPNLSWGTLDLGAKLSQGLKTPVFVDNDANIAAVGEMTWGAAQGCENFLVVTLGTGVGTGVVVDGKVLQSTKGGAGEAGHITVEMDGRKCGCGCYGHLEAYASATGIMQTMKQMTELEVSLPQLSELLNQGDEQAKRVYEYTAKVLGTGLASMASILFPEKIIIAGGVSAAGQNFLRMIQAHFEMSCFPNFVNDVTIELSALASEDGAIVGASSLAFCI